MAIVALSDGAPTAKLSEAGVQSSVMAKKPNTPYAYQISKKRPLDANGSKGLPNSNKLATN